MCNSKTIEICPNQHANPLRFNFTDGSWKIKNGPPTSFQATFFTEFFDKKLYFVMLNKVAKFHYQTLFTSQIIQ